MKYLFKGSAVALVTPFDNDGSIDFVSLEKLINLQLLSKTDAIVVLGTTGEPATLSMDERLSIIRFAKEKIKNKAKLIVGTGANSTKTAITLSLQAQNEGVDGLLVVTPYYNKCTQNGLVKHFEGISKAVNLPIIAYNVPGRTGVNILPQTAERLSKIPNIVGIKEASGNISQMVDLCAVLENKMAVYSGDDSLNYVFMSLGAMGVISVTANAYPKEIKSLVQHCLSKDFVSALNLHNKLLNINKDLFVEVNPTPIKYVCSKQNLCKNILRLPLLPLEKIHENLLDDDIKDL
jgi:4-hydroxy-tetrahydrodipicolinate synthase